MVIKECREERNLSQYRLAKIAGISPSYLNEIEHGLKSPSLHTLEKIGNALKIHPFKLVIFDTNY